MAAKKKTKKKSTKSKRTARKKATAMKGTKRPQKPTNRTKKKTGPKRAVKAKASGKKRTRKRLVRPAAQAFSSEGSISRSGEQSGDSQGLSRIPAADSESVEDLVEEGNAFEADAVSGVEAAEGSDEKEVRTHEVPEDDVPGEYLDKE
jgi:N utilization substance protein A